MKPVLILQHMASDSPGYFGTWLKRQGIPAVVANAGAGESFPSSMEPYAALAILGGAMSANDDLPYLRQGEALIRQAMDTGRPVIGHCLGGQLMSKALGGCVTASPAPEVGWQPFTVKDSDTAREWFPAHLVTPVMHWHYESFSLPAQSQWLASSSACPHQAFCVGPHLAMQFHIEIDAEKLAVWMQEESDTWSRAQRAFPGSVQGREDILARATSLMQAHHALADHIYARWWRGVPVS